MKSISYRENRFLKKKYLFILAVSFLFIIGFFLLNKSHFKHSANKEKETRQQEGVELRGFSFFQTKEGVVQWEVKAKKAEVLVEKDALFLREIKARFLSHDGSVVRLEGETGKINTKSHDFFIKKEKEFVKIILSNGTMILTKQLNWSNSKNEIFTKGPVQIVGPGFYIKGVGLTAGFPVEEISIRREVQAVMRE